MPGPVGHISNQRPVDARIIRQQLCNCINQKTDDVDISPLGISAEVIDFTVAPAVDCRHNATAVIVDVNPVAHIQSLSVDRQLASVPDIVYHQRNKFLRVLIGPVVVAATSHHHRQSE